MTRGMNSVCSGKGRKDLNLDFTILHFKIAFFIEEIFMNIFLYLDKDTWIHRLTHEPRS